jgi:hypothetical protein
MQLCISYTFFFQVNIVPILRANAKHFEASMLLLFLTLDIAILKFMFLTIFYYYGFLQAPL